VIPNSITVTKRFEFEYAHMLPGYDGKCKNLHGHHGVLEVEIGQFLINGTYEGMVIDFSDLKRIVEKYVIDKFDHHYLNDFIPISTAENMTLKIVEELQIHFGKALKRVRVYETPDSYAEWRA